MLSGEVKPPSPGVRSEIRGHSTLSMAYSESPLGSLPSADVNAIAEAVARVELFSALELSDDHTAAAYHAMRPVSYDVGAAVYEYGESATIFFVVQSGSFEGGWPLRNLTAGSCFGEEALLGGCVREQRVVCLAAGSLWALEQVECRAHAHRLSFRPACLLTEPFYPALSQVVFRRILADDMDQRRQVAGGSSTGS